MVTHSFVPQELNADEDADTVTNLFDTHLFQDVLVAFDKIATIDVVHYNYGQPCSRAIRVIQSYAERDK